MRPEVVPVLHGEPFFRGPGDLGDARQTSVGKDVSGDPGIALPAGDVGTDGVQHEDAVRLQTPGDHIHERAIVPAPDMLEHAHGNDPVKGLVQTAVIALPDLDRQTFAELPGKADLLLGDVHSDHFAAVRFGREPGQPAPTAPDVQKPVSGPQLELVAQQTHLIHLGPGQVFGIAKAPAAVLEIGVEKSLEQIIAQIVVMFGDNARSGPGLQVENSARQCPQSQKRPPANPLPQTAAQRPGDELVNPVALPPSTHIPFSKAEISLPEHLEKEPLVRHPDIPGPVPADLHVGFGQHLGHQPCAVQHDASLGFWRPAFLFFPNNRQSGRRKPGVEIHAMLTTTRAPCGQMTAPRTR